MELNDYTILSAYVSSETKIILRFKCGSMEESVYWATKRPLAEQYSMFHWKQLLSVPLNVFPRRLSHFHTTSQEIGETSAFLNVCFLVAADAESCAVSGVTGVQTELNGSAGAVLEGMRV